MRCKACDKILEDNELVRKDRETQEFLDLCDECFRESEEALERDVITSDFVMITYSEDEDGQEEWPMV